MQVKIDSAEVTWKTPDGTKELFKVVTSDGVVYKTWSKTIGKEGWSGEVEVYEKNGEQFIKQPYSGRSAGSAKSFKADPAKLEQDLKLQIATNQSIQRQVCLKAAIDLIVAGKREYSDLDLTYYDLLNLLNPKLGGENANNQSAD